MSQPIPRFIPHEPPAQLDPAPELPLSRWEQLWERVINEALAWKRELSDWGRERAWLSDFWENRKIEWTWFTRGTNQAWGFIAIAFWERISRADIEALKYETNLAEKTPPNTFALVIGAGVTLWIVLHFTSWRWPLDLLGLLFIVLQGTRVLMYLGSPMKVVEPLPQRPRRRGTGEGEDEDEWIK